MCNCFERTEKEYKEYLKQNDPFFKDLDINVEFEIETKGIISTIIKEV